MQQGEKTTALSPCGVFVFMLLFEYPKRPYRWAYCLSVANIWLIRASEMAPKTGILARYWATPHNTEIVQKPSSHAGLRVIARHCVLHGIKRSINLLRGLRSLVNGTASETH